MKMSEERKQYLKDYREEKLKRIPLDVSLEMYERIQACAKSENKSVNGLIKSLTEMYLKHRNF